MNTFGEGERDLSLDLLRAAAIVYIVGIWHIKEYSPALSFIRNDITLLLTNCVLALFFHISGYLLTKKNKFQSWKDVKTFYAKRFLRIYPMYIIVLAIFLFFGTINTGAFFRAVFLTNMFTGETLMTLWFVTLILIFYILTPLFLYRPGIGWILIFTVCLFAILAFLYGLAGLTDRRFAMFLPAFASGMLTARSPAVDFVIRPSKWLAVLLFALFVTCSVLFARVEGDIVRISVSILAFIVSIPIFRMAGTVLASFVPGKLIGLVCYASYAAYLIHRITFPVGTRIYQPEGFVTSVLYLAGICLPATFGVAYLFQKTYDSILSSLKRKKPQIQ